MPIKIDRSQWPVLSIDFDSGDETSDVLDEFHKTLLEHCTQGQKIVLLFDLSPIVFYSHKARFAMVLWLSEHKKTLRQAVAGTAFIVSNEPTRIAIHSLATSFAAEEAIGPIKIFSARGEAIDWSTKRMERSKWAIL
jgi:hypothetical protein